ncbi:Bug family tripartite tricarboxylate transporter substrate binding protein [Mariluticola halotolerans]|uniref:Bug family tripartite tricarboxylate transporter substrate binding protein n=1 Tax=Mariluticola halotolerans TaxID=2909283 RepID=UPI0026E34B8D|nr:tripartite tricarboxylate transporter substrate binding protein [Mariluticola halotolerans]UJQ94170.1 tripartite tricarboxylate transporter substrate binding protein [Mariluticola halotolerans]
MKITAALSLATALTLAVAPAIAQEFPSKPITLINPYSAGGPADLISRTLAEGMSSLLGQPVVVENRTGAATAIAATAVAESPADGYTLLIAGSPTHIVVPALQSVNYDGIKDFTPVATVALVPNVLAVNKDSGITSVEQLVAKAKEGDDVVSFASVGNGSLPHLSSVFFQLETGTKMVHIPYKGAAPAVADMLGGNVDMGFLNAPPLMPHFESGDLIALGVAAGKRSAKLPDVPTMEELGFNGFEMSTWYGISAPAGTPDDVVAKLSDVIGEALAMPEIAERLAERGVEVNYMTNTGFGELLATDSERMLGLIDSAGLEKQ